MAVTGGFSNCHCGPDTAACQDPTQPVAAVGLCLPSGAPIAVTLVRDCAGATTQEGWLDLSTGAWSEGAPPEGTAACGGGQQSVGTSGVLCDVKPDGQVAGLVLVEYQYAADGSVDSVRLVDAATGEPYTLVGELRHCPAGVEQPERDLIQLCDVAEDGTATAFLRDFARDEAGQIVGFTDYTLAGESYTVVGAVGPCGQGGEGPADVVDCDQGRALLVTVCDSEESPGGDLGERAEVQTGVLCVVDTTGAVVDRVLAEWVYGPDGERTTQRLVDLVTGEAVEVQDGATLMPCPTSQESGPCRNTVTTLLCDIDPECREESAANEPDPTQYNNWGEGPEPTDWCLLAGEGEPLWGGGSITLGPDPECDRGNNTHRVVAGRLTAGSPHGSEPVPVTASVRVRLDGPSTGQGAVGRIGLWDASTSTLLASTNARSSAPVGHEETLTVTADVPAAALAAGDVVVSLDVETNQAGEKAWRISGFVWSAEVPDEACVQQFARAVELDCETGAIVSRTDTTLDGEPYEPSGTLIRCQEIGAAGQQAGSGPAAVLEECRCDDTDGDGQADTSYVALIAVGDDGELTTLGTYTDDLSAPYTPVSPVGCDTEAGGEPARGAQARRVELADGATWDAAAVPLLQSVSATAHGGTGTVTTADGTTVLREGETASWSLSRDGDAALMGPLTIAADTGAVTVTYTAGAEM